MVEDSLKLPINDETANLRTFKKEIKKNMLNTTGGIYCGGISNKLQLCRDIYYTKIFAPFNMFIH